MKAGGTLLAVRDLKKSLEFYQNVLGLEVVADYGANVALEGGLSLQTLDTWADFLGMRPEDIAFGGHAGEVYFEADDFDAFLLTLEQRAVPQVRPPLEHRWGQRVVRLYDPDRHIVEVGEAMAVVARRFQDSGLDEAGVARRMDVPQAVVRSWPREHI